MVSHYLAIFDDHWSSAGGDIKYLTCHVTFQNHVVEGSSNFISESSSRYITTLPSLVTLAIIVVEICF